MLTYADEIASDSSRTRMLNMIKIPKGSIQSELNPYQNNSNFDSYQTTMHVGNNRKILEKEQVTDTNAKDRKTSSHSHCLESLLKPSNASNSSSFDH